MQDLEEWLTRPGGVAARMRELRSRAGLSGSALAQACSWPKSKVSKIEAGKQLASHEDIDTWIDAVGATPQERTELYRLRDEAEAQHLQVRYRLRLGMPAVQGDYAKLAAQASLIRTAAPTMIPGLLQVPGYVEAIMHGLREAGYAGLEDQAAAVGSRLERQRALYDLGKRFEFVIGEPALRWHLADPPVMRSQFDRLQTAIDLPNVRLGIIPFGRLKLAPLDTFDVYVDNEGEQVAVAESDVEHSFHRGEQAQAYSDLADRLWSEAVTGDDARKVILAAAEALGSA